MSDLTQRREDATVGRRLRELAAKRPTSPRTHISWWDDDRATMRGTWLCDDPLWAEKHALANAAEDLIRASLELEAGA
jgi:hypothetical protein